MKQDPWLSAIPASWDQIPLKYLVDSDNSGIWGEEEGILEKNIPVSTTAHIDKDGNLDFDEMPIRSVSLSDYNHYKCIPGDIIVVKSSGSGTNIITGKSALVLEGMPDFSFGNFLLRLRAKETMNPGFLYSVISSGLTAERIRRMVSATTYPNLKVEEYLESLIPVPPLAQQEEIYQSILEKVSKIDTASTLLKEQLLLLGELRQSTVTSGVLGAKK
jgi:type I restriction enzyme S subunit